MAKFCINCGKKIPFLSSSAFDLPNENAVLCTDCCGEAKALLMDIKCMADREKLPAIKEKFLSELELSGYSSSVKQVIKREFNAVATGYTAKPVNAKAFYGSFEESCRMIADVGNIVSGDKGTATPVINTGECRVTTFVFESYFLRTGTYASLTVNLVNCQGLSSVTVIGSGGGDGVLNMSWGTEKDFVNNFWQTFSEKYPHVALCNIEEDFEACNSDGKTDMIGILGGTFDPIHLGHKALGEAALREGGIDKLIVMPARVQPFKQGKRVTEDFHRFAMAKLTFEGNDKVEVSDYELNNTTISYTYDTLKHLKGIYPDKELCFILGTDSYLMLEDWYKGVDLLENFSFIVGVRPGYRETELDEKIKYFREKYSTKTRKITADMPDISATEIREKLKADKSIDDLVADPVERYIKENGLYN